MRSLDGTETKKNLETALQGEALAHLKYQFYRSKIGNYSKEYEAILDEIVHNEKEHAKIWFKLLHDGEVPEDSVNLEDAIKGEFFEFSDMYPEFGRVAHAEGFHDIAELFESVAEIEGHHAEVFNELKKSVDEKDSTFVDDNLNTKWKCLNCGHIVEGGFAPDICPVCKHPQKYFVRM